MPDGLGSSGPRSGQSGSSGPRSRQSGSGGLRPGQLTKLLKPNNPTSH